jgi:Family of unknown function (DUF6311)
MDSLPVALLLSLCVAIVLFGVTLGFSVLNPGNIRWCLSSDSDATVYFFSFAYYRHAPWAFPITRIDTLFYPVGSSVTIMDGLPLVAVPLKLFNRILPDKFQFLGAWLFLCTWLQTFFGERFLRVLKLPTLFCWAGAIMAATAAPFQHRFGHVALSSHWVILAAMAAVCAARPTAALWLMPILGLWIHAYLFAITFGLCVAGQLRFARTRGAVSRLLAMVVGTGGSLWVLGYLHMHQTKNGRFEYYSADLSTLFNSMGKALLLPGFPIVGGDTFEGYAYLGCGGLILAGVLVVSCCVPSLRRKSAQNWWLFAACFLMALYSLSTAPRYLGQQLFRLDHVATLIEPISSRLRGCARFIWPLFYYLMFFGLKALHALSARQRLLHWAAPALLVLQTVDLWPSLRANEEHAIFKVNSSVPPVPEDIASQLTPETRYLIFVPPIKVGCEGRAWHGPYQRLALWGAEHGLITNANLGEARSAREDINSVCKYTRYMFRGRAKHPEAIFIKR